MTTIDEVLSVLNGMLAADPAATHALVINRVPCTQAMVDHPHVVVDALRYAKGVEPERPVVGLLGVLNGLLNRASSEWAVALSFNSDERALVGFVAVPNPNYAPPQLADKPCLVPGCDGVQNTEYSGSPCNKCGHEHEV